MKTLHRDYDNKSVFAMLKMFVIASRAEFIHDEQFNINEYCAVKTQATIKQGEKGIIKHCGTVACIGGWAATLAGLCPGDAVAFVDGARGDLKDLFYPAEVRVADYVTLPLRTAVLRTVRFLKKHRQNI